MLLWHFEYCQTPVSVFFLGFFVPYIFSSTLTIFPTSTGDRQCCDAATAVGLCGDALLSNHLPHKAFCTFNCGLIWPGHLLSFFFSSWLVAACKWYFLCFSNFHRTKVCRLLNQQLPCQYIFPPQLCLFTALLELRRIFWLIDSLTASRWTVICW